MNEPTQLTAPDLTPEQFRDALAKGLGRAMQYVRAAPPETVRKDLLHACLNFLGYSVQEEGTRSAWHFQMIEMTGEPGFYRDKILDALKHATPDKNNLDTVTSLLTLAYQFAIRGDHEAGTSVIRKYRTCCPQEYDYDLWGHLVFDLEGLRGLDRMMHQWSDKLDRLSLSWIEQPVEWAEEEYGANTVKEYLDEKSLENESIRLYWERVLAVRSGELKEPESIPLTFTDILEYLKIVYPEPIVWTDESFQEFVQSHDDFRELCWQAHKIKSSEELYQAFEMLLREQDPCRQELLLSCFYWPNCRMPRFEPQLLSLLDSPFEFIRCSAARSFSYMDDPRVRAKGLEILADAANRSDWIISLKLLENSFAECDFPLLESAIQLPMNNRRKHSIGLRIGNLENNLRSDQISTLQLWKYENSPCSKCREFAVSDLIEHDLASRSLLEECLDDANEEIQKLAETVLKENRER